jgi:predicted deacetylase
MWARYLLRFDDLCPTMNWDIWNRIETILLDTGVKPLLAVVPDNRDNELMNSAPDAGFWDRVRGWQRNGWAIGLHGYQHIYEMREPVVGGVGNRSEFAGLPEKAQRYKLEQGLAIFAREGIRARLWIAPGHGSDDITLGLLKELKLGVVSDGLTVLPWRDARGLVRIPQQMWRFRRMPFGLWTVCMHHNHWAQQDLDGFERNTQRYRKAITSLEDVLLQYDTEPAPFLCDPLGRWPGESSWLSRGMGRIILWRTQRTLSGTGRGRAPQPSNEPGNTP